MVKLMKDADYEEDDCADVDPRVPTVERPHVLLPNHSPRPGTALYNIS
jgi:hypothetical protein